MIFQRKCLRAVGAAFQGGWGLGGLSMNWPVAWVVEINLRNAIGNVRAGNSNIPKPGQMKRN